MYIIVYIMYVNVMKNMSRAKEVSFCLLGLVQTSLAPLPQCQAKRIQKHIEKALAEILICVSSYGIRISARAFLRLYNYRVKGSIRPFHRQAKGRPVAESLSRARQVSIVFYFLVASTPLTRTQQRAQLAA